MKALLSLAALGAATALGASAIPSMAARAATAPAVEASPSSQHPQIPPWGFDLAGRDTAVAPGNDFYDFANGAFVKKLVIPPDRSRYGAFDALQALSERRVRGILEKAAGDSEARTEKGKIGAFYRAFMDERRANALGDKPIAAELTAIRAADSREKLATLMGQGAESFYGSIFDVDVEVDEKNPDRYAVYLGQSGLGLPDRDYYLDASFAAKKAKYQAYVAQMLGLIGWPDADAEAQAIVDMETQIAKASWSRVQERDPTKTYNPLTPAELVKSAPGFDWIGYLAAAGLGRADRVVVAESDAIPKIAAIFAATPVKTLQAWEAFNVADSAAPFLSKPFVDANFEFRAKTLRGQLEQRPRWKRAVSLVNRDMGFAVGRLYVAEYFPPPSRAKMLALVGNIRAALAARIQRVDWMSEATKAKALRKLSMLNVKVGYPTKWRDYSALSISGDDLVGDVRRASAFEWRRRLDHLGQPVDKTEWSLTPQTVNAYYSPPRNEIVFPAAILQPPFFDPAADPAIDYGGIGGVIGHEMTHGFDDQGRHFDGAGRLTDWWTAEDDAKFRARAKVLGEQYSATEPLPGVHINGDQTMGENIADLGGLLLALDAYHASLDGRPAPVLSGLTGDQRVFLGWAQVWRGAIRPDALKEQLVADVHSPDTARVNNVVRNIDAWYAAWNIKPGDKLYLAPDQRVHIW